MLGADVRRERSDIGGHRARVVAEWLARLRHGAAVAAHVHIHDAKARFGERVAHTRSRLVGAILRQTLCGEDRLGSLAANVAEERGSG
jgi:hypothetical protein